MDQTIKRIYDTMQGFLESDYAVGGVEDAFKEGSICARAYEEMRGAYERLCDRLGAKNEDPDLDIIINKLEEIQKELCRRMFLYGARSASQREKT